jgi:hypothetical protein
MQVKEDNARRPTIAYQYTLSDFDRIICNGFDYLAPPYIIALISSLADQVGAPTYVKTPIFPKGKTSTGSGSAGGINGGLSTASDKRGVKRLDQQITDDDWESIRAFQATELIRVQGIESHINTIRACLNRLTNDSYLETLNTILKEISDLTADNANTEHMLRIGTSIFNTASSNQFYSEVYARLYHDLIKSYPLFETIFESNLGEFLGLFNSIEYCDPKKDYDKFCTMNKNNDRRKAMSLFIVNLMKQGIVSSEQVIEIVINLQKLIREYIKTPGKSNELDEISENIFIIIKNSHEELTKLEEWANVLNSVTYVSLLKVKSYPSITNKTIFKHTDILELFQ